MSKVNRPFLSLGAHGSLGSLTTVRRPGGRSVVMEKPIPSYRFTLEQAYQRWLYQDYALWWTEQSLATREEYRTAGVPHHLTGFQMWMKTHLAALTNIMGWYTLDERDGAVIHDRSRRLNHGTIIGATPGDGLVAGGYYGDGVNDLINCGTNFNTLDALTVEFFMRLDNDNFGGIVSRRAQGMVNTWQIVFRPGFVRSHLWHQDATFTTCDSVGGSIGTDWHHVALRYDRTNLRFFVDGEYSGAPSPGTKQIQTSTTPLRLFMFWLMTLPDYRMKGWLDHVFIWDCALSGARIKLHSERRYPLR